MEIRTYTNFWNLERKFYSFFDISLPVPVSLVFAGLLVGTGIPWALLMWLVQMPLTSPWFLIWIMPPVGLAYLGSKPIFEQKTLFQFLATQIQFLLQDRRYKAALTPDLNKYGETIPVSKSIFILRDEESDEVDAEPINLAHK